MGKNITVDTLTAYKEILSGTRKRFPNGTWDPSRFDGMQNFTKCFRYLVNEVLQLSRNEALMFIDSKKFFVRYKLISGITMLFDGSPYSALRYAFPEWDIEFWEMRSCPHNCWNITTIRRATRWLFLDKLGMTREEILKIDDYKKFIEGHGMGYMLRRAFNILAMDLRRDVTVEDLLIYSMPDLNFSKQDFDKSRVIQMVMVG